MPLALIVGVSGITPIFSSLYHAFVEVNGFADEGIRWLGFSAFRVLTRDRALLYSLNISTLWALCATALTMIWAVPVAALLHRYERLVPPGMVILAIVWIVPVFIAAPIWRMFFHGNNGDSLFFTLTGIPINLFLDAPASFLVVLFISVLHALPPVVLVVYAGMRRTPTVLLETAVVEGARDWQVFRYVHAPEIRSYLFLLVVVTLIGSFREFTMPYLMTAGGPPLLEGITERYVVGATTTLEIYLYDLFSFSGDLSIPSAYAATFLVLFLAVAMLWYLLRDQTRRVPALLVATSALLVAFDGDFFSPTPFGTVGAVTAIGAAIVPERVRGMRVVSVVVAIAVAALVLVQTAITGILAGFQPALLPALGVIIVITRRQDRPHRAARRRPRAMAGAIAEAVWTVVRWVGAVTIVVAALLFLYLLLWISFSEVDSVFVDRPLPRYAGPENYGALVGSGGFGRSLGNSLMLSSTTALLTSFVAFLAAGGASVHGISGRRIFVGLQFLGLSGGIHALIPLFALVVTVGLVNSYLPIVLLYAAAALPVGFYVLYGFVSRLPGSLYDAARIAGAGRLRYLITILLPLSRPAFTSVFILAWITAWNGFLIPLIFLTTEEVAPLSVYLHNLVGTLASGTPRWGLFAAGSTLNIGLLALLFLASRRHLQYGTAADGPV